MREERKSFEGLLQWAWDATSLDLLMLCPRRYQLAVLEGWVPKKPSAALEFGRLLHLGREAYCRQRAAGETVDVALRHAIRETLRASADMDVIASLSGKSDATRRTRLNLIRALVWWVEEFGGETDPVKTLVLPDKRPAIELSFALPLPWRTPNGTDYMLCGHMDRLVEYLGARYVGEWKHTTTTLGPYYWCQYAPNTQISIYVAAARVLLPEHGIQGAMVDATQIGVNFVRFGRHFVNRTRGQNEEFLSTLEWWIKQAERYAQAEHWPMNESACHAKGGCPYRGICALDPQVRERFMRAEFTQRENKWDPLDPR